MLQVVDAYWRDLRRKAKLPLRQDLTPAVLDTALPHCFIAERTTPGVARMRVAGQALQQHLKLDPRGMPVSTFLDGDGREALMPLVEAVFQDPAIVEVRLSATSRIGRPRMTGRLLLLPMRDVFEDATRILGALVTDTSAGLRRTQFRLADDPIVRFETVKTPSMPIRVVATATDVPERDGPATGPALRLVVNNG